MRAEQRLAEVRLSSGDPEGSWQARGGTCKQTLPPDLEAPQWILVALLKSFSGGPETD